MVYQNNNSRVNPNAEQNTNREVVAHTVDREIKYQPSINSSAQWKNTGDALARIGQGMMDYDFILQANAKDDAIIAYEKTEAAGKNKNDWAEVSRNVKGMAKFNPYVKDSFRNLVAQDIYNAQILKTVNNPNLAKMSSEEYNTFIQNTKQEMFDAFNESHLSPKDYHDYVEKFAQHCDNMDKTYTAKNSEYNYNNFLIKSANNLSKDLKIAVYNAATDEDKIAAIQETINNTLTNLTTENGVPDDDLFQKVFYNAAKNFAYTADGLNQATLEAALRDININGKPVSDFMPNYEQTIHELAKQARRARFEDRQMDYQEKEFDLKINNENATKDFVTWSIQNPNASGQQYRQKAIELIQKYGIEEDGISFLNQVASQRGTIEGFQQTISNEGTLNELGMKLAAGELSSYEVQEAIQNGTLSWKDGLSFLDRLNKEEQKIKTANDKQVQQHMANLKKDINGDGKNIKPVYRDKTLANNIWSKAEELKGQYDSGAIDYATFNKELAYLKSTGKLMQDNYNKMGSLA